MDKVTEHYEAYPYPARNPKDELKRLVAGSPSDPAEIEHYGFGGARDWSTPLRVLVAGGGTGDATIMLAQRLHTAGLPHDITYLDLSVASRKIAEARLAVRELDNVRFITGDLAEAPRLGPFDYIDCCGVLHHLPTPQTGFEALAAALAPSGVLGGMVYAPLGRSGVYPLQAALRTMTDGLEPSERVQVARRVIDALPESHPFKRNTILVDHKQGDAGLYDLLLHARDVPFTADAVIDAVENAGLQFASFLAPARYDPTTWAAGAPVPKALTRRDASALAEQLCGAMKSHVFYACKGQPRVARPAPDIVPRLRGMAAAALAGQVASGKAVLVKHDGTVVRLVLPKSTSPLIRLLDGRRTLGDMAKAARLDWLAFAMAFGPVDRALRGHGLMLYSRHFS